LEGEKTRGVYRERERKKEIRRERKKHKKWLREMAFEALSRRERGNGRAREEGGE